VALPQQTQWPAIVWDQRFASAEELAEATDLAETHCLVRYYVDEHAARSSGVVSLG
jgi:hypothetical protein